MTDNREMQQRMQAKPCTECWHQALTPSRGTLSVAAVIPSHRCQARVPEDLVLTDSLNIWVLALSLGKRCGCGVKDTGCQHTGLERKEYVETRVIATVWFTTVNLPYKLENRRQMVEILTRG